MSEQNFDRIYHVVPAGHIREYARSTSTSQNDQLSLAVTQYKPRYSEPREPRPGDLTILAAHANAFPKELYEPMFDAFLLDFQAKSSARVRSIWIADIANQGASGVLNEDKLGNEPSWHDHARDFLALVNHFRDEMPRPIVGIGHSMGGTILINLALMHPRLLSTIVLVEPMINKSAWKMNFAGILPISKKRDRWNSRDEAIAHFQRNVFYEKFDPRVTALYKEHGLRDEDDGSVTLITSKDQEALTFGRAVFPPSRDQLPADFAPDRRDYPDLPQGEDRNSQNAFYRPENTMTYHMLPFLRPSCLYIHGSASHFAAASAEGRKDKMEMTGVGVGGSGGAQLGRVQDQSVDGTHFAPFEHPEAVAERAATWIADRLAEWRDVEGREERAWQEVPHKDRRKMSDDWLFWAQKMYGRSAKTGKKARL